MFGLIKNENYLFWSSFWYNVNKVLLIMCFAYYVNKCILNKSRGSPGTVLDYSIEKGKEKRCHRCRQCHQASIWIVCKMAFVIEKHPPYSGRTKVSKDKGQRYQRTDTFYWYFIDSFYRYFIGWQNRQNGQTFTFTDTFYSNRQTNRQNKQAESFFGWREHCIQFLNCTGSTWQRPWHYLYLDPLNTGELPTSKMFHSKS